MRNPLVQVTGQPVASVYVGPQVQSHTEWRAVCLWPGCTDVMPKDTNHQYVNLEAQRHRAKHMVDLANEIKDGAR